MEAELKSARSLLAIAERPQGYLCGLLEERDAQLAECVAAVERLRREKSELRAKVREARKQAAAAQFE